MKLLVITQTVDRDDSVLGFFFPWLEALATKSQAMSVICLGRGAGTLPAHVQVFSLGKERRTQPSTVGFVPKIWNRVRYVTLFYWYILKCWGQYDTVFVHMNQEYVLLAGWLWRLSGKKVTMWRNHAQGSVLTTAAVFWCNRVFCTSPTSYTARFPKTILMPVGVDTHIFKPTASNHRQPNSILFLARIAPVKKPEILVEALGILAEKHPDISWFASLYGSPLPKDESYYQSLKMSIELLGLSDRIQLHPGVPYLQTPALYAAHEIFINLTPPGSFDKTIVEALASGALLLTANTDLADALPKECVLENNLPDTVAARVRHLLHMTPQARREVAEQCRDFVARHSLDTLIEKLVILLSK